MRIDRYNPTDMSLAASDITGVDFGATVRGGYPVAPVVIKPVSTIEDFSKLFFFLEDDAGLTSTTFRVLKSSAAITGIGQGSAFLTGELNELPGIVDFSTYSEITGDGVILDNDLPEYIWTDVKLGTAETVGSGNINYRFIYEYA